MTIASKRRMAALGLGLMIFCASSTAEAVLITDVRVVIGGTTYTAATVGWQFPVDLALGQDLVLTQNYQGTPNSTDSFNFDTSDVLGPQNFPQIFVTADGVTYMFTDQGQVLNVKGIDTLTGFDNEAQHYSQALPPFMGLGFQVFVGYADNTHTGPCGGWANSVGLNGSSTCLPANGPFFNATYFQGRGGINPPQLIQTLPNHCSQAVIADCFEGGVIRILATQQVPEPAVMALLLTGTVLTLRHYRHRRRRQL